VPYSEAVQQRLATLQTGKENPNIRRNDVLLIQLSDRNKKPLGYVVRTPWKSMDTELVLWWTIRNDNVVKDVMAIDGWPDKKTKEGFKQVIGLASDQLQKCSTAAELTGAEVLMLCKHN